MVELGISHLRAFNLPVQGCDFVDLGLGFRELKAVNFLPVGPGFLCKRAMISDE